MIQQGRHTSKFLLCNVDHEPWTKLWITTSSELSRVVCSVFTVVAKFDDLVQFTTLFSKQIAAHPDEGLIKCYESTAIIMYQPVKMHLCADECHERIHWNRHHSMQLSQL